MSKRLIITICTICLLFLSLSSHAEEITVSAAISLKDSFEEIGKRFEKEHQGVGVIFNFSASGVLRQQIEGGAPVDVFASASPVEMDRLQEKGLIIRDTRLNFAGNAIVLIVPARSKLRLNSFDDLRRQEIKRIVIGNPETVPAGRYAKQVLKSLGLWNDLSDKLIFAEHVRQVLDYVARTEVDAGMVYSTDARLRIKDVQIIEEALPESHSPVVYPIAVVKGTKNRRVSEEFISFVISDRGRAVLEKYGFKPAGAEDN